MIIREPLDRLVLLRDFLRDNMNAPEVVNHFDMCAIASFPRDYSPSDGTTHDVRCASYACMLGWATAIPELQNEGLRLTSRVRSVRVTVASSLGSARAASCNVWHIVSINGSDDEDMLSQYFGLRWKEFHDLFFDWPEDEEDSVATAVVRLTDMIEKKRREAAREQLREAVDAADAAA